MAGRTEQTDAHTSLTLDQIDALNAELARASAAVRAFLWWTEIAPHTVPAAQRSALAVLAHDAEDALAGVKARVNRRISEKTPV